MSANRPHAARAALLCVGLTAALALGTPAVAWAGIRADVTPTVTTTTDPTSPASTTTTTGSTGTATAPGATTAPTTTSAPSTSPATSLTPPSPTTATTSSSSAASSTTSAAGRGNQVLAQSTTAGVLRDAATGAPIPNACVAWTSVPAASPPQNSWTGVGFDGTWSFQSDQPGPFDLAFYTSANGDCSAPIQSNPVPSWYANEPLTGTDPTMITPPSGVGDVAAGATDVVACLGATALPSAPCAAPTAVLSGTVLTTGNEPVDSACIFVLAPVGTIAIAITDPDGTWLVDDMPVNYPVVIGVVPPFDGSDGPCANQGPPPVPEPGALQPEMYANTWVDLTDTTLFNDPYGWGVRHGATAVTNGGTDLDVCITTDVGTVVPRPSCTVPTSSTTTSSPSPTMPNTPPPGPELAQTGTPVLSYLGLAAALIAAGSMLLLTRARSPRARARAH